MNCSMTYSIRLTWWAGKNYVKVFLIEESGVKRKENHTRKKYCEGMKIFSEGLIHISGTERIIKWFVI